MTAHPQTITSTPSNAGEVGHPEYGRHKPFSLRVMEALADELRQCKKLLGFATLNDLFNVALLDFTQRAKTENFQALPMAEEEAKTTQASVDPEGQTVEVSPPSGGEGVVEEVAPTPKATKDDRDPLERFWEDRFAPLMKQKVTEKNFDIWLASCRFLAVSTARCILEVPTSYFFEYLWDHYKEVIEEALHELVGPEAFLKLETRPERQEEPKPAPKPQEEKPLNKYEQRIAILWNLQYSTKIYAQYDAIRKQLEAKWAEEDRAENPPLRQPGDPQRQRQYHQGNKWDPDP